MKLPIPLNKKILFAGFLLVFVLLYFWTNSKHNKVVCNEVEIILKPEGSSLFLDKLTVAKIASGSESIHDLVGKDIQSLDLFSLQKNLSQSPFVEQASVFLDYKGTLSIHVVQKIPLFRVINQQGSSYYVEKNGFKIPHIPQHAVRVPIITGYIEEKLADSTYAKSETLQGAVAFFNYLDGSEFWKAQIEQVYVDKFKDFLLIPKVGNHTIVLGKTNNLEEKLDKLYTFYMQGLQNVGWDKYSSIFLNFEGQVVAKKRN